MASFPNAYIEQTQPLEPNLDTFGNAALDRLHAKGYEVTTGLTRYYAGAISIMAQQPHIGEYCPKDPTVARFGTEQSTERWLQKGGGRATFLLLSQVIDKEDILGHKLQGYGWTGYEPNETLPQHPITSAYRLGASALGKHVAGDFIQTVVSGTHKLYAPNDGIGLETWQSNHAAGLYLKVGFVIQSQTHQIIERRPTIDPKAPDGSVEDTRLYMAYPNELFT